MGGIFGGNKDSTTYAPMVNAMRVQTSCYGRPIPLVYGKNRLSGNLIWYGDFVAIPVSSSQSSGGKGAGGGSQTNVSYIYQAGVAIGICAGPVAGVGRVWKGKQVFNSVSALFNGGTFLGTFPTQTPWAYLTSKHPGQDLGYQGMCYVAGGPYDLGSAADLGNHSFEVLGLSSLGLVPSAAKTFTVAAFPFKTFTVTPGSPNLSSTAHGYTNGTVLYFASSGTLPAPLLPNTPYYVTVVNTNTYVVRLAPTGTWNFFNTAVVISSAGSGTFRSTKQSDIAAGSVFTSTSHNFVNGMVLRQTTTGTLPAPLLSGTDYYATAITANTYKLSMTVDGAPIGCTDTGTGTQTATPYSVDCRPSDVLTDFFTDVNHGALFPSAQLGSWTQFSNYVTANNLLISPIFDNTDSAANLANEIVQAVNCELVFSEGVLKVVPYGDATITGNGVTFTPNLTPVYDITDDDYVVKSGEDPVTFERTDPADAFNTVKVEFLDRSNNYAPEIAEAQDMNAIRAYGQRIANTKTLHWICDQTIAQRVAQLALQRMLYVRNLFTFNLGWRFAVLEPMDLLTISDSVLGINQLIVRVKSIEENEDGELTVRAEDALLGSHSPPLYNTQVSLGYSTDYNADPGSVTVPVFVDAPGILTATGYEVWLGVAGGTNWGGAEVWVSTDNATFKQVGTIFGNARYGAALNTFPVGADPDTVNALQVDLAQSLGTLTGGTQADADAFNTLAMVDRELISFQTATLISGNQYTVDTYIRRGIYRSAVAAHIISAPFIRLDQALFHYAYDPALVGQTIYFKFVSFNKYNHQQQDISTLPSYAFSPQGSTSFPSNVTGFSALQNDIVVLFQWDLLQAPADPNIDGYEIRRNPLGITSWVNAEPVTQVTRGTSITTAKVPPGSWTFLICARDHSGNYSRIPTRKDLVVLNAQTIVKQAAQEPTWPGTKTGFLVHCTGKLVFESTVQANTLTNVQLFEQFVPFPVASATYEAPEIDAGADGSLRIWGSIVTGYRADKPSTSIPSLEIDYCLNAGAYTGFQAWTIGTVNTRFVKERFTITSALGTPYVSSFIPTLDAVVHSEAQSGLAIGAGGTAISFTTTFFITPVVTFENDGSTPLLPTVTGLTSTGFTGHLYNTSGTQVGGTGKYSATGV